MDIIIKLKKDYPTLYYLFIVLFIVLAIGEIAYHFGKSLGKC